MYTVVIWDWNGTLLDDVDENIQIVNELLAIRSLPAISREVYKRYFRMPIRDFYSDIGFDFTNESFEEIAKDYNTRYTNRFSSMPLTNNIEDILQYLHDGNIQQFIVSASEQKSLDRQVAEKRLGKYFRKIVGNDDFSVASKLTKAKELRKELAADEKILFIGDMYHDYEVAQAIGADCILYGNGHQETTKSEKYRVIHAMAEIKDACSRRSV